ncbi:MAG: chloride channel protein [Candidatus Goldiibacteriota bacterium HGW-Goldbacteria-1]|jgi:CIC family chloride channel protein|nr:MAG: chloride channel protein [Candidatus Goldiibacteriota bacterium HGW-Goldbacteria-1]
MSKKDRKSTGIYNYIVKRAAGFIAHTGVMTTGRWIYFGAIVGVISAVCAMLFALSLKFTGFIFLETIAGIKTSSLGMMIFEEGYKKWLILVVPAFGGLVSGWLTTKFAPDAKGHGTDYVIKSFHKNAGNIFLRVPVVKIIATAFVIGTGGSAGREGPIAQIGAGFASVLARFMKLNDREKRLLIMAGAAGGIAAIFGAPLGGAIFAAEVLYRNHELEAEVILPSIISSIVAFSIFRSVMGIERLFSIGSVSFSSAYELIPYTILGVGCAVAGIVFVKLFNRVKTAFNGYNKISVIFKPALGGFLLGVMALYLPGVLGGGYQYMQMAFDGSIPVLLMFLLAAGKMVSTSLTIGSGGSGGIFAPSLFIGAMTGGAIGGVLRYMLPPGWMPPEAAFIAVGMGGLFACVARVPLASLIMVSEMTRGYDLLVPMMLVSVIAFLLNRKPYTVYDEQVNGLVDSPAHRGDFEMDVLEDIIVTPDIIEKGAVVLPRRAPIKKAIDTAMNSKQGIFPVIDQKDGGRVVGVFSLQDIKEYLLESGLGEEALVEDITQHNFIRIHIGDRLHSVVDKFTANDVDALPVIDEKTGMLMGMFSRDGLIKLYNKKLIALSLRKSKAGNMPAGQ